MCSPGTWIHPDPSDGPLTFDLTKKNIKHIFINYLLSTTLFYKKIYRINEKKITALFYLFPLSTWQHGSSCCILYLVKSWSEKNKYKKTFV